MPQTPEHVPVRNSSQYESLRVFENAVVFKIEFLIAYTKDINGTAAHRKK